MTTYDAIVVGAGPAGSATAALLARRGFSVLLLDRVRFPRDKACGEYTSPETENVLRRIGALEAVVAAGARLIRAYFVTSERDVRKRSLPVAPSSLATSATQSKTKSP